MKSFILFLFFLSSLSIFSQGSSIGRSYISVHKELSQDKRVKIDYSYRDSSKDYLLINFLTEDAFKIYEFSNGYVFKENLLMRNKTIEDWASFAISFQKEGWNLISNQKEGEDFAARLTKEDKKILVAFSPSTKIVGIITTKN